MRVTTPARSPFDLHTAAVELWLADAGSPGDPDSDPYATASAAIVDPTGDLAGLPERPVRWIRKLIFYESYTAIEGRTPRENSTPPSIVPSEERRLGEFARYQRRHESMLSSFQRARLEVSTAFVWDLRDAAWFRISDRVEQFHADHGRAPFLTNHDPEELSLARWLARQLRALKDRALASHRAARLNELLSQLQRKPSS